MNETTTVDATTPRGTFVHTLTSKFQYRLITVHPDGKATVADHYSGAQRKVNAANLRLTAPGSRSAQPSAPLANGRTIWGA